MESAAVHIHKTKKEHISMVTTKLSANKQSEAKKNLQRKLCALVYD
jgi:hypothetical protein